MGITRALWVDTPKERFKQKGQMHSTKGQLAKYTVCTQPQHHKHTIHTHTQMLTFFARKSLLCIRFA